MSESSLPSHSACGNTPGVNFSANGYQLSDDLAKLCLPREFHDSCRTLAWVNSICALFLILGLIGLKPLKIPTQKPTSKPIEVVPVLFTPPAERQQSEPQVIRERPAQETSAAPLDVPEVTPVIAVADASAVAFPVPVQKVVAIAPMAHLASPPPRVAPQTPSPVEFAASPSSTEGFFPSPEYPTAARRNGYQGTVTIDIKVDQNGVIQSAEVFKSSGFSILDNAALQTVRKQWRFTPGKPRWLHWPCTFKIQ